MAFDPSNRAEDQTDEDFFDRLVNDNDEDAFKASTASTASSIGDGNESDEAKCLANSRANEVKTGLDDTNGRGPQVEPEGKAVEKEKSDHSFLVEEPHVEEVSAPLVSSDTLGNNFALEPGDGTTEPEAAPGSSVSELGGSVEFGVKEVQWSAFNADASNAFGSYSDFFSELGEGPIDMNMNAEYSLSNESNVGSADEVHETATPKSLCENGQYQGHDYVVATDQCSGHDPNSYRYWENLYPGWKYDTHTGQWYQLDSYDRINDATASTNTDVSGDWPVSHEGSFLRQSSQPALGIVADGGTAENVANWNQISNVGSTVRSMPSWGRCPEENSEYPSHMIFDPQYPGWYYDTIAQEWRTVESYTSSAQSQNQCAGSGFASINPRTDVNDVTHRELAQSVDYESKCSTSQSHQYNWNEPIFNHRNQESDMWEPDGVAAQDAVFNSIGSQKLQNHNDSDSKTNNHVSQQRPFNPGAFLEKGTPSFNDFSWNASELIINQEGQVNVLNDCYENHNSMNLSLQAFHSSHKNSYVSTAGRSSARRPPHALVTFGFGGKLIVMKDNISFRDPTYGSQDSVGLSLSVLNLAEVVTEKAVASIGGSICDYFRALCWQSFPGPLAGGSVGTKELNKWFDERITQYEFSGAVCRKSEVLKLLLSLLKIACQHYGKFRSPFGAAAESKGNDVPESAIARLFSSPTQNVSQFNDYSAIAHCLQKMPCEEKMLETAAQVQSLLVSGRKKEALHCACEGQLWGPALILAAQLGDEVYANTVKQMALQQLVAGSPLRTLCLLIAGQPAEVFAKETSAVSSISATVSQQPTQVHTGCMLDAWKENLAVIVANRTKDDELVLTHLGDCLWQETSEIVAAHICYLIAEANFEPYSNSARLCLLGADHWNFPRTYARPEAIQRTEIFEYSKLLGNSQFVLLSFQPYKLIYAHMLAEVGRVSDSLKYCQAVLRSLKTGRSPEVETWRQLVISLEERIRTHQQGGFSTNLAPAKLVGRLLNLFDSTAHRVVGGLQPSLASTSVGNMQGNEHYQQSNGPRISSSQSTMAMSSLVPSASEPVHEKRAVGNRTIMHSRSVSEPDIGRTPRQESTSVDEQGKASGGISRLGRFGFGSQLFQKTVGFVLKSRHDRQAKLGETNKFYYDEKLKRWVEEGAEPPAEEAALPPPPTAAAFQNGIDNFTSKNAPKSDERESPESRSSTDNEYCSGVPPIPPTSKRSSARGRMGVRSRYVDTFNKGEGNPPNLFQPPSITSRKSTGSFNPTFFVPASVSAEQTADSTADGTQDFRATEKNEFASTTNGSHKPFIPSSSSISLQRLTSLDDLSDRRTTTIDHSKPPPHSRRTVSWSGNFTRAFSPPKVSEPKPLGEVLGLPLSSFMHNNTPLTYSTVTGGNFVDELHEVEL